MVGLLTNACEKFEAGFQLMVEHKLKADVADYAGWRDTYRVAMKDVNKPLEEVNRKSLEIEVGVS